MVKNSYPQGTYTHIVNIGSRVGDLEMSTAEIKTTQVFIREKIDEVAQSQKMVQEGLRRYTMDQDRERMKQLRGFIIILSTVIANAAVTAFSILI